MFPPNSLPEAIAGMLADQATIKPTTIDAIIMLENLILSNITFSLHLSLPLVFIVPILHLLCNHKHHLLYDAAWGIALQSFRQILEKGNNSFISISFNGTFNTNKAKSNRCLLNHFFVFFHFFYQNTLYGL
jgi:hypothetical protein